MSLISLALPSKSRGGHIYYSFASSLKIHIYLVDFTLITLKVGSNSSQWFPATLIAIALDGKCWSRLNTLHQIPFVITSPQMQENWKAPLCSKMAARNSLEVDPVTHFPSHLSAWPRGGEVLTENEQEFVCSSAFLCRLNVCSVNNSVWFMHTHIHKFAFPVAPSVCWQTMLIICTRHAKKRKELQISRLPFLFCTCIFFSCCPFDPPYLLSFILLSFSASSSSTSLFLCFPFMPPPDFSHHPLSCINEKQGNTFLYSKVLHWGFKDA